MYLKWQTVAKLLGGSASLILVLVGIFNLSGMSYNIPEDIYCGENCYSEIQVNSTYWEVCVEHAGERDIIFKKQARSRRLWVNLDRVEEFMPTNPQVTVELLVPTIKKYSTIKHDEYGYLRPVKDGDVLIARFSQKYHPNGDRFVIHGIKGKSQTVKWGLELESLLMEDIKIDPLWMGEEKEEGWLSPNHWLYVNGTNQSVKTAYGNFTWDDEGVTLTKFGEELGKLEFGVEGASKQKPTSNVKCRKQECNLTIDYGDSNILIIFNRFRAKILYEYTNSEVSAKSEKFYFNLKTTNADEGKYDENSTFRRFKNKMMFDYSDIKNINMTGTNETIIDSISRTNEGLKITTKSMNIGAGEKIILDPTWTTPSSVVSYSGQDASYPASNTHDDDTGTYWYEGTSSPDGTYGEWYITYDMGSTYDVQQIQIYADGGGSYNDPCKVMVLKVCDDSACSGESDLLASDCMFSSNLEWQNCDFTDTTGRYIYIEGGFWRGSCVSKDQYWHMYRFYEFDAYVAAAGSANGVACSVDGDCTNSNCVEAINEAVDYCAAATDECSRSGYATGYDTGETYDSGGVSWICKGDNLGGSACGTGTTGQCDEYAGKWCDGAGAWTTANGGDSADQDAHCIACKDCGTGTGDLSCSSNMPDNAEDNTHTTCTGLCVACQSGSCGVANADSDPDADCGTTNCYTGNCNGTTAVCKVFSDDAKHSCGTCEYCHDGSADGSCDNVPADSDPAGDCGVVQCDGDAVTPYYHGWDTLECFYRLDEPDGACDGSAACKVASDYCGSNGQNGSAGVTCDCVEAEIGCTGTTIGSCDNGLCGDSCDWTSGNFEITCSENCTIDATYDLMGNNITTTGPGMIYVDNNVTNFTMMNLSSGCAINLSSGIRWG